MTDTTTLVTDAPTTTDSTAPVATEGDDTTLVTSTDAPSSDTKDTPTEGDKPEGDDATKDADAPKGAPEAYEDFTMPEGVTLDPEVADELKALSKDLDLPQEKAQRFADLGAKLAQKWAGDLQAQIDATSTAWSEATKADKEIGGDKLPENLGIARAALDKFGTPELRTLLTTSKLGNNPEVVRLLVKVGRAISDDARVIGGGAPAGATKTLAERMYPTQ